MTLKIAPRLNLQARPSDLLGAYMAGLSFCSLSAMTHVWEAQGASGILHITSEAFLTCSIVCIACSEAHPNVAAAPVLWRHRGVRAAAARVQCVFQKFVVRE